MKRIRDMPLEELAGFVCQTLNDSGLTVTLSGGSCVAIWSLGEYVSNDLDFIEEGPESPAKIRKVLQRLGFVKELGRHFSHPESPFFIEFPAGPLAVGDEVVVRTATRKTPAGTLRLLTPTDCVKDRLAAFFHWNDPQSLRQALLVAKAQRVDLKDIARWSRAEGHADKFKAFEQML